MMPSPIRHVDKYLTFYDAVRNRLEAYLREGERGEGWIELRCDRNREAELLLTD